MNNSDVSSCSIVTVLVLLLSGALSNQARAWTKELNFNRGAAGQQAQGNDDAFDDAAGNSYYSTQQSYEGGMSAELNINAGETAFGRWGGIVNHPSNLVKGDELWVRVRTFMPAGFDYDSNAEGNRLKFLRVHTRTASEENHGYDDWYINPKSFSETFSFIYEGEQVWANAGSPADKPTLGKWETYEMYLKLDDVAADNGGTARIRMWKDGKLLANIANRKTLTTSSAYAERTHLFTYWNGGAPKTQRMWVDDIVVTSDRPSNEDADGNPFVGLGVGFNGDDVVRPSPPSAPGNLEVR